VVAVKHKRVLREERRRTIVLFISTGCKACVFRAGRLKPAQKPDLSTAIQNGMACGGFQSVMEAEQYIPGLREHTVTRLNLTPEDYRTRTHQKHHSFGGVPPVMGNKPPAHKTPIKGCGLLVPRAKAPAGY